MPDTLPESTPTSVVRQAWKLVAVAASTAAALVTVFKALYSYGVIGEPESHETIGNLGAAWVGVRPVADTASAFGDTLHFVATISDKNGSVLVGARPVWTIGDSTVAKVLGDGSVIARGSGATTVSVVVGNLVTRSKVVVKQRVAWVDIVGDAGDSVFMLRENAALRLHGRALDARGNVVTGQEASWQIDDSSVAVIDSMGTVTGRNAGRTVVTATIAGISSRARIGVTTTAATLTPVAGMNQSALAGRTLSQPIVVRATNRRGAPAVGQLVTFRLASGQGVIDLPGALTDADGRARAKWTLADFPGRQKLLVSVENVDTTITVEAEAEPIGTNTRVAPVIEQLTGRAGELTSEVAAVRVTDSIGRALPDVIVRWSAVSGGSVEAIDARTDSMGVARARWKLAAKTGTQRLRAQVGGQLTQGIRPVSVSALVASGPPSQIDVVSGGGQRAAAGATLKKPVVFRVADKDGNPVTNASIVLSASGGKVPEGTLVTDSAGIARTPWTMGHSAGEYALAVHVDGIRKLLKVNARAVPAAAANLSFEDEASKGTKGKAKRLSALVTDVYGNPVPDARVTFASKSGTVVPMRAVSDARGRVAVTWTTTPKREEQQLTGIVAGTDVKGAYIAHSLGELATKSVATAAPTPVKPAVKQPEKKATAAPKASSSKTAVAKPSKSTTTVKKAPAAKKPPSNPPKKTVPARKKAG